MKPHLVVVGLNHRTAPVGLREQLAVPIDALPAAAASLRALPGVHEAMLVSTCNRVEIYAAGEESSVCAGALRSYFANMAGGSLASDVLYEHHDEAAVRHVFDVAASLDSMVVGEPQILGQVKDAFAAAKTSGAAGPALSKTMARAFGAAKRVRTETAIGTGSVSMASVAVDLATQIFGELEGRRVLVVGAGKMAMGAARALVQKGARLSIANRNYDRAADLAKAHGADAHPLDNLPMLLAHVDVVVCSTGASRYVITDDMVATAMRSRRGRSLFVVDISVPRNVDPRVQSRENVYLFDVDDLEREVARALGARGGALEAARRIVADELAAYAAERRVDTVVPTVTAMRERFRAVAHGELNRSLGGKLKSLAPDERIALEAMVEATVNKLLHAPTAALRAQAGTAEGTALAEVLRALFALPSSDAEGGGPQGDGQAS